MLSKPSRSRSPERHAGQKRSAPSTPKVKKKNSGLSGKSSRKTTVPEPPVTEKEESHPRSHDRSRTEEARSHNTTEFTGTDQAAKTEVGEGRIIRGAQCERLP